MIKFRAQLKKVSIDQEGIQKTGHPCNQVTWHLDVSNNNSPSCFWTRLRAKVLPTFPNIFFRTPSTNRRRVYQGLLKQDVNPDACWVNLAVKTFINGLQDTDACMTKVLSDPELPKNRRQAIGEGRLICLEPTSRGSPGALFAVLKRNHRLTMTF